MKRLLFICACIFFLPVLSFAVDETCVVVAQEDPAGEEWAVYDGYIVLKCTAADDASMSFTFGDEGEDRFMGLMDGRWVLEFHSYDGATTDPTTDTDLHITDSDGRIIVNYATNGDAVIDDGDDHTFYPLGPDGENGNFKAAKSRPWTISWEEGDVVNAENEAENYLRIGVTGSRFVRY